VGAAFLALLTVTTVKANPVTFSNVVALQNGGFTHVDLFSNPGTTLLGPQISFLADISGTLPASGFDTLQVTFAEAGKAPVVQTFNIPIFNGLTLPYSQLFTFTFQNATFQGTDATLTLDILGSNPDFVIPSGPQAGQSVNSYTYSFKGAQPVPEPATVLLLGLGLAGSLAKYRKRRAESRDIC
jgi:hypothetical protein